MTVDKLFTQWASLTQQWPQCGDEGHCDLVESYVSLLLHCSLSHLQVRDQSGLAAASVLTFNM